MPSNRVKFFIFLIYLSFAFFNYSLAEEFFPIYTFKVGKKVYLFSVYKPNLNEIGLIYNDPRVKNDNLSLLSIEKIQGKRIEFNFSNGIKIKGILDKSKKRLKLTYFIDQKNKLTRKIISPWVKLDEITTQTATFKIKDKNYKISFLTYKDQLKIKLIKERDPENPDLGDLIKIDFIANTNRKILPNYEINKPDGFSNKYYKLRIIGLKSESSKTSKTPTLIDLTREGGMYDIIDPVNYVITKKAELYGDPIITVPFTGETPHEQHIIFKKGNKINDAKIIAKFLEEKKKCHKKF
ncbi:MAG: hypothetical protein QXG78_01500 [Candidatus Methanomethyliaceae archaeon]